MEIVMHAKYKKGKEDLGNGCAWRCLQTCLSVFNLFFSFKNLLSKIGLDDNNPIEWAEPGYGKRICDKLGLKYKLYRYKKEGTPKKTLTEWCVPLDDFIKLEEVLFKHFKEQKTPVMIDDVTYAWTILGVKKTDLESSLYYLILNQDGKREWATGIDNRANGDLGNGMNSVQQIDPEKGWLLFFPEKF